MRLFDVSRPAAVTALDELASAGVLAKRRLDRRTGGYLAMDVFALSGDALHIAVAAEHGSALATRDAAQAQAAEALGVPSRLVAGPPSGPS
jgi:hypothetical protein